MPVNRGRGGSPGPSRGGGSGSTRAHFPKPTAMPTAKQMDETQKLEVINAQQATLRSQPPQSEHTFQLRFVIAGEHLVPGGLDESELHKIREKHRVWVKLVEPHVLELASRSIQPLREAVRTLNWTIHDLRCADNQRASRFLVQCPSRTDENARISFVVGKRPVIVNSGFLYLEPIIWRVIHDLALKMTPHIAKAADTLMGLGKALRMRVNFGRLNIRQKKKNSSNELTYDEFRDNMDLYTKRGAVCFGLEMSDVQRAEAAINGLLHADKGICGEMAEVTTRCTLVMKMHDQNELTEINADVLEGEITRGTLMKFEEKPRMDWTMVAPDRQFDWNLRINALDEVKDVPRDVADLITDIRITDNWSPGKGFLAYPSLKLPPVSGALGNKIAQTCLRSSALIPFSKQQYVAEVSLTRRWKGTNVTEKPESTWAIEVYALHWDEAINNIGSDDRRRDWGLELGNIWAGDGPLDERIKGFLSCMMKMQEALDALEIGGNDNSKEKPIVIDDEEPLIQF